MFQTFLRDQVVPLFLIITAKEASLRSAELEPINQAREIKDDINVISLSEASNELTKSRDGNKKFCQRF